MRLKNHTNIDSTLIRALIKEVRPSGISNFDVRISNYHGRRGRGMAYHAGSSYHSRACPFVVVSIAKTDKLARYIDKGGNGYLPVVTGSRMEVLVYILAHELRHLWQAKVKRGYRVWGSRGQFSERDASAYGLRMLRRYRRGELTLTPPPVADSPQA